MARRPDRPRDDRSRDDDRRRGYGDPYDRDEDADSYGQYGGLDRGLGYGGGGDLGDTGRFGRGRDPEGYPRGGRHTEGGWQDAASQDEVRGRDDRPRRRERGWTDRASDEVASWFGDEEAARRREADHRGKGPRGYRRSDARIQEDVSDRLTDDPDVDATDITVTVKEGEVTLDGHVESRFAKRRAEDCAEDVSGVSHVQNNLRVRPAPVSPPPQSGGGTV